MKTVSFAPLSVAPLLWEAEGGEWSLTVVAKATLWLVHGGEATLADEQQPLGRDRYFGDNAQSSLYSPSDWAPIKSRADVLLVGHAYAPEGTLVPRVVARVEVGSFSKAIHVFGDRVWVKGASGLLPSEPAPFSRMPISYELAARGPDNPVGIHASGQVALGAPALPNIEAATKFGVPGLGPLAPSWRSRQARLTAAGRRWSERMTGPPPRGFDYSFFNAAPVDQQIDLLRIGSTLRLTHLHPDLAVFETRLPSIRPRAYVVTPGAGAREVPLRSDTLWIDPDHEGATISWRGLVAVDARDIESGLVAVVLESKTDPHPFRHVEPLVSLGASDLAVLPGVGDAYTLDEQSSIKWEPDTTTGILELARSTSSQRIGPTSLTLDRPKDVPLQPALPFQRARAWNEAKVSEPERTDHTQDVRVDLPRIPALPFEQKAHAPAPDVPDAPGLYDDDGEVRTLKKLSRPLLRALVEKAVADAADPTMAPLAAIGGPLQLGATPLGGAELGGSDDRAETQAMRAMPSESTHDEGTHDESTQEQHTHEEHTQDDPTYAPGATTNDALDEASIDAPLPSDGPLALDRYAAISAEIAVRRRPVGKVIEARGVSLAEWQTADRHYRSLFSKGSEVGAFDRAYVAALDELRAQGPIKVADYARIVSAVELGELNTVAASFDLSLADLMRVQRVWSRRVTEDPALATAFAAARAAKR